MTGKNWWGLFTGDDGVVVSHLRKHQGTKLAQISNLKGIRFTQSVDTAGAGGETRTPNIQIRSLIRWNSKDK